MCKKLMLEDVNTRLSTTDRILCGEYLGWDYSCSIKCLKCNNVENYFNLRSALRGKCHNCNDIRAHRGIQSAGVFNKKIFEYGWIVEGKYNGEGSPCDFKCLKCGNINHLTQAKSIKTATCKNCTDNICLSCGKKFIIANKQGKRSTRAFCYECLPESTTKEKGRYSYNKLHRQYIINLVKERYGTKCNICGYDKCYSALDFHHLNKTKKQFDPAKIINSNKKVEDIYKELDKCILICSNCHREIHEKERKLII